MSESKKVSVTVIRDFRDKNRDNRWMSKGYKTEMSESRANELAEKGLVAIGEEGEKVMQQHTEKNKNAGPNKRKRSAE